MNTFQAHKEGVDAAVELDRHCILYPKS